MSQSRPAVPEPTEIAGRYQVIHKLGAGAFGTVYKAKDRILGRMVAIKTIRLEGLAAASTDLEELLKRFRQEAQVAAQLKHPNIVTIYDIGDFEGLSYLAMEFIDGVGLDKVIASTGPLPLERAASIGAQVADALDFAYRQQKIVHRDIKPANIMLETGDRVKVTDFGIAKSLESGEHLTVTGSLLGTPSYMSPEQARATSQLDGRSDLFSVGCVLYEMLAGKKAFRGDSITALIFKIITEEPPALRELAPDVPEEMVRIIAKAIAKKPEDRYQAGGELARDLLALTAPGSVPTLRQAEVSTTPVPAGSLVSPTLKSPATLQGTASTAVVKPVPTQVAPPTVATPARPSPRPPLPQATPTPPPARPVGGGAGLVIGLGVAGLLLAGLAAAAGWYFFLRKPAETQTAANAGDAAGTAVSGETTAPAPPEPLAVAPPPASVAPAVTASTAATVPTAAPTAAGTGRAPTVLGAPPRASAPSAPAAEAEPTRAAAAPSFLDEEPTEPVDGRQAGEQLAGKYRSPQGGGSSGPYGPIARFRSRPRSPHPLAPFERPAIATLRHVINAEEAFQKKHGRYGTFAELATAQTLFLDVPHQGGSFRRAGYRFELSVNRDGFRVTATPLAPGLLRSFHGDDSGYILEGID